MINFLKESSFLEHMNNAHLVNTGYYFKFTFVHFYLTG